MSIVNFPGTFKVPVSQSQRGEGGGGGSDMEGRIASLEATVKHMDGQIGDVKDDIRELRNWGLAAVGLLLVAFAGGYIKLSDKSETIRHEIGDMKVTLQKISDAVATPPPPVMTKRGN